MTDITVRATFTLPNICDLADLKDVKPEEIAYDLIQSEGLFGIWDADSFEIEQAWVEPAP